MATKYSVQDLLDLNAKLEKKADDAVAALLSSPRTWMIVIAVGGLLLFVGSLLGNIGCK